MYWGIKLVRRLWAKGGTLHQRIRLLPFPIDDLRMLQLVRSVDILLDPFPIGSSLHANALALSVGTPIVTFKSGCVILPSKSDLNELETHLHNTNSKKYYSTLLFQSMVNSSGSTVPQDSGHFPVRKIPFLPTISPLAGYFQRIQMEMYLVANNTNEYFTIASKILNDREYAYNIRWPPHTPTPTPTPLSSCNFKCQFNFILI
jgi:hypothetical protein